MDNAPWFDGPTSFDAAPHPACRHRRVRRERHHLSRGAIACDLYFNQSGNGWSDAARAARLPAGRPGHGASRCVDLLGTGTACLVWSSPLAGERAAGRCATCDLMAGEAAPAPSRRSTISAARLRIHYAPSTKFYLADKEAGRPWVTRLPFVLHVVERIETFDHVSRTRLATRYAYHHGYYDGLEREFRGFAMVEQWDSRGVRGLVWSGGRGARSGSGPRAAIRRPS